MGVAVTRNRHQRNSEIGGERRKLVVAYDGGNACICNLFVFHRDFAVQSSASHYRDFVFARGRIPGGGFPEDSLGQTMHAEICAGARANTWHEVHSIYG